MSDPKKNRLWFRIVSVLAFGFMAYIRFNEYAMDRKKRFEIVFGVAFLLLTLVAAVEVVQILRSKKEKSINN